MTSSRFEYDLTIYPADQFQELVYVCTATGECAPAQAPAEVGRTLTSLLNDHGSQGWELVQTIFSSQGIVAIWKRPVP